MYVFFGLFTGPLKLDTECSSMIDFYEANAPEYNASTVGIDPSSFLEPLARRLPPGAAILDVGCGSGRDLRWFKERGFRPMGLERSPSLAELARNHSGCPVMEADFETHDFPDRNFDALVLVGALVHIPHNRLEQVLDHLIKALRPGGHALITLKEGRGITEQSQDRFFYLWQDPDLRAVFDRLNLTVVDFSRQTSKIRETDIWLGYVLKKNEQII
jgi:SAM-dependent methyltransferase